jgi:hypothetical protein
MEGHVRFAGWELGRWGKEEVDEELGRFMLELEMEVELSGTVVVDTNEIETTLRLAAFSIERKN